MLSSLFTAKNVIVQGITGSQGQFHTRNMVAYGTNVVAGTSPTKAGSKMDDIPVYATIMDIRRDMPVDISVIFVPAAFAKSAIFEAINAEIPLIVCITEHIPVHDMIAVRARLRGSRSTMIGPNCPGVLVPGGNLLGIIPARLASIGDTAVVSRSGTLTYEAMDLLTRAGLGQRYIVGIGGDMIRGTGFVECLEMFEQDPAVKRIVMIGEIGGTDEMAAGEYAKTRVTKPIYAYVAGHHAPVGVQMGHAGAIVGDSRDETADTKTVRLRECGITVANNLPDLIGKILK